MPRILILSDYSSEYSRRLLKGVVRYAKERGDWSFYRMPLYYREQYGEEGVVAWAKRWKADAAIIAQANNLDVEKMLEMGIPIVFPNQMEQSHKLSTLTGNYIKGGAMAANYFMAKGYRHFAFYGTQQLNWSEERCVGFRQVVEQNGYAVHLFGGELSARNDEWTYSHEELSAWLKSLPKPVAIFSSADYFAIHITETCRIYNINVPQEIAVLGVDDDRLICEISDPPLTSIQLDIENAGYQTAAHLHKLIVGELTRPFNIVVDHTGVMERKSTERYATDDKRLLAVISYIHKNFRKPMVVSDLLGSSLSSRRVLEKKFKEQFRTTIYQFILNLRIERLSSELIHSSSPLYELAESCGFDDPKNISRIFKKLKGITPAQYRKKFKRRDD